MKYTVDDIIDFLKVQSLEEKINEKTNICDEIGIWGDDFDELIFAFAEKFSVDMNGYLWYFHSEEESSLSSVSMFPRANEQVARIPITPLMLTDIANSGKWKIDYPEHKITHTKHNEYGDYFTLAIFIILIGISIYKLI